MPPGDAWICIHIQNEHKKVYSYFKWNKSIIFVNIQIFQMSVLKNDLRTLAFQHENVNWCKQRSFSFIRISLHCRLCIIVPFPTSFTFYSLSSLLSYSEQRFTPSCTPGTVLYLVGSTFPQSSARVQYSPCIIIYDVALQQHQHTQEPWRRIPVWLTETNSLWLTLVHSEHPYTVCCSSRAPR